MFEQRRMHPVAGFLSFLKQLKELLLPFIFIFFVGPGDDFGKYYFLGAAAVILLMLVFGILHWYRYTYRIENGELRIEYGVFIRKKRFIPIERIQTIDVSAGIIQRIFGLVKLQVETAGGGMQAEAVLTAIKEEEANQLRELLSRSKNHQVEETETLHTRVTYQITSKELLVLASTSGGIGIVISGVLAFLSQFAEYLPFEKLYNTIEKYVSLSILFYIIVLVALFLLIAWFVGILIMTLRYANFTVVKRDDELFISRGLIEKKQTTIPLTRIQAIRIGENLIRQPLGYATVYIESAGGSLDKGEDFSTVLFPLVKKAAINDLLGHFVPDYQMQEVENYVPSKAKWRYMVRGMLPFLIFVPAIVTLSYVFSSWGYLALVLLPIGALFGHSRYKVAGWKMEDNQLTLQFRFFSKITVLHHKKRIQSLDKKQSFLQKKKELGSVKTFIKSTIAGKGFEVKDLHESDCWIIWEWYTNRSKKITEDITVE
ncbi:PH domain-containing protein [Bacillus sp. REN16]|uniref:PH domain-containing protein n=1 Tax=Bacillus sp. REN16 TaxID=2887296 RepID=UPI001E3CB5AB|nr:PH domain-containing protein [Bacillus sp. REN16]MCC3358076.1 PH domain-containing protein [Bacillus sp. REN16]